MPRKKIVETTEETVLKMEKAPAATSKKKTAAVAKHKPATKRAAQTAAQPEPAAATPVAAVAVEAPVVEAPLSKASPVVPEISASEIAKLAYSYWEQRGYAPGDPTHDWLRAEHELRQRFAQLA